MSQSIILDPQYGVNPSCTQCFICGEAYAIVLVGNQSQRIFGTQEAPRQYCDGSICDHCQSILDQHGIFFIEVEDGQPESKNPLRTGLFWALTYEAASQLVNDIHLLDQGIMWIEQLTAETLGFHQYIQENNDGE